MHWQYVTCHFIVTWARIHFLPDIHLSNEATLNLSTPLDRSSASETMSASQCSVLSTMTSNITYLCPQYPIMTISGWLSSICDKWVFKVTKLFCYNSFKDWDIFITKRKDPRMWQCQWHFNFLTELNAKAI